MISSSIEYKETSAKNKRNQGLGMEDSSDNKIEDSPLELLGRVLSELSKTVDKTLIDAWFIHLELDVRVSSRQKNLFIAELISPNQFTRDHIEKNYINELKNSFQKCLDISSIHLEFSVRESSSTKTASPIVYSAAPKGRIDGKVDENNERKVSNDSLKELNLKRKAPAKKLVSAQSCNLNENYNFSNFVVGSCNQFAHAVSIQVSQRLGNSYNPLFIYGGVGLGKTHLVNAIGNTCRRKGKSALLVSSEFFVNELITALRTGEMQKFKSKFRSLDLLIIDDIQFLIGKERTQEEFFHTFNELHQKGKQIVITSDKVPQDLIGLEERLRTRFSSGLAADMQPPDFETRIAILNKKAEAQSIELPNEVFEFVAEKIDTNVRELEGALNRIAALSAIKSSPIDLQIAEEAVKAFSPQKNRDVNSEKIKRFIALRYNVSVNDLEGKRRTQNVAHARQIAMYICRELTGASFPEIGTLFGRDHTTALYAYKTIDERISTNTEFKRELDKVLKDIHQGA